MKYLCGIMMIPQSKCWGPYHAGDSFQKRNIKMQYKSLSYLTDYYGNRAISGLDLDDVTGVSYDGAIRNGLALWYTTGADLDPKSLPIAKILQILKNNQ